MELKRPKTDQNVPGSRSVLNQSSGVTLLVVLQVLQRCVSHDASATDCVSRCVVQVAMS